jgi:sulfhydrogenase subunit gamma (sulfur reductase)
MKNPYVPNIATIKSIRQEVCGPRPIKTFHVEFDDPALRKSFIFNSGQTAMVSVLGTGESIFAISSPSTREGYLEFSVMKSGGKNTTALHDLEVGDQVGVRGPYGNWFPLDEWQGKNLIFIGGGIGQAPLRSVYMNVLDRRAEFGNILIIYGARTSDDLAFVEELEDLEKRDDVEIRLCLDWKFGEGGKLLQEAEPGWTVINVDKPECTLEKDSMCTRFTCFVPELLLMRSPSPDNSIALTCGPPIMIKFVIDNLVKLGFQPDQIYTTLEMRMKCGIGKCGRCNIGNLYVCKDGPVFSYQQLQSIQGER